MMRSSSLRRRLALAGISVRDAPIVEAHPLSPWVDVGARMLLDRRLKDRYSRHVRPARCWRFWRRQSVAKSTSQRICQLSVLDDAETRFSSDPPLTTMLSRQLRREGSLHASCLKTARQGKSVLASQVIARASTAPPRSPNTGSHRV